MMIHDPYLSIPVTYRDLCGIKILTLTDIPYGGYIFGQERHTILVCTVHHGLPGACEPWKKPASHIRRGRVLPLRGVRHQPGVHERVHLETLLQAAGGGGTHEEENCGNIMRDENKCERKARKHPRRSGRPHCRQACLSAYLSVCLSVCLSVYISVCLHICLSVCLSCLPACTSVCLIVCPRLCCLLACLCLSECSSVLPFVCMPVCLSVFLFFCLPVGLPCLPVVRQSVRLPAWVSVCPSATAATAACAR